MQVLVQVSGKACSKAGKIRLSAYIWMHALLAAMHQQCLM